MKRNIFTIKQISIFAAILLCLVQGIAGRAQIINTVVGNGNPVSGGVIIGDNGPAAAAQLNGPKAVVVDGTGNIYIADGLNSVVRKINASGVISTIAGNYTSGYSGDNGLATAAQLKSPQAIALDTAGNLYIADYGNNRVRKVDAVTGIITTVAGTGTAGYNGDNIAATTAQLKGPSALTFDNANNLYITDATNNRIRKVDAVTGIITTVVGAGTAGFSGDNGLATAAALKAPNGIAFDAAGNLYIADYSNNRIRKVDVAGIITTIAGTGTAGYNGDNIAATTANLKTPWDVRADAAGNLYISDYGNSRIRKIDASGNISTIAGTSTAGYNGDTIVATTAQLRSPAGIVFDAVGNLYIADLGNQRIRKIDAGSGIITSVAGLGQGRNYNYVPVWDGLSALAAQLGYPSDIAFNAAGDMYIANTSSIRKVSASTGIFSTIVGSGKFIAAPPPYSSYTFYNGEGGPATAATLFQVSNIIFDKSGNLFISMSGNQIVCKVDEVTGIITTVAGSGYGIGNSGGGYYYNGDSILATTAQLDHPAGLAFDTAGNLYIADAGNFRVRKVDLKTGIITTVAGIGAVYGSGVLDGDGGPATAAHFSNLSAIAFDASNNLYIGDWACVRKVDASGTVTTVVGSRLNTTNGNYYGDGGFATAATLLTPTAIKFDAIGNLFISDAANYRVRKVDMNTGIINTVAGNGTRGFSGDGGLATAAAITFAGIGLDAAGNLYIGQGTPNFNASIDLGSRVREVTKACSSVAAGAISNIGNDTLCVSGNTWLTLLGASASGTFFASTIRDTSSISYQWQAFRNETGWVNVGTDTTAYNTGNITATTEYRVVVTCKAAGISDTTAIDTVVVQPAINPAVSIAANTGASICPGTNVTFTATPVSGGNNPVYQWSKNGTVISGVSGNAYTDNTLNNNDTISCVLTSNYSCLATTTAQSNTIKMSVTSAVTPSVSISADLGTTICAGTLVTFIASPAGGGANPTYQWTKNNVVINGISGGTYTDNGLNNNDYIQCTLTSSATCASPATTSSNTLTMAVTQTVTPIISIGASGGDTACAGSAVIFTATTANGGTAPTYQWTTNGTISGSGASYTTSSLNNQDLVACTLISSATCATPDTLNSNALTMTIVPTVAPSVNIGATTTSIKSGEVVIFTATPINGGANTSYQWRVNGVNVPGATTSTYVTDSLVDANSVTCVVHSDAVCATPDSAISNAVVIHVSTGVGEVSSTLENLTLSPNPNNGTFNIAGTINDSKEVEITVLDVVGQVVYQDKVVIEHNQLRKQILLSGTNANGIYLLRLKADNGSSVKRFVIDR